MSGIVGGINLRSSGLVNNSSASDGQVFTGTGAGLPAGFEAAAGGGKVLQIVSASKTDTWSTASTTFADIPDMTVTTGTLGSTSNKILVTVLANCGNNIGGQIYLKLFRGATAIAIGDTEGIRSRVSATVYSSNDSAVHPVAIQLLDSGSFADTSAVTYKLQMAAHYAGSITHYINRSQDDTNAAHRGRTASTITAMEIGA